MCAAPVLLAILSGCADEASTGTVSSEVQASTSDAKLAALKASVKGTDIAPVTDYGKSIGLTDYPKGTSVEKILSDVTGWDESDFGKDTFSSSTGKRAVEAIESAFDDEAKRLIEDGEEDAQKAAAALKKLASATRGYFDPAQFSSVVTKEHGIQEDGDLESHTLIATKRDGSIVVLSYTNFPF